MTVTGHTYHATRVRGLADWKPQKATLEVVAAVRRVLEEYRAYLPLTARQIFYRLVGTVNYPKTEQAYSRLLEYLNRARRAAELLEREEEERVILTAATEAMREHFEDRS